MSEANEAAGEGPEEPQNAKETLHRQAASEAAPEEEEESEHLSSVALEGTIDRVDVDTERRSFLYEKLIRPILHSHDTPESISLGAAVGMFVALTPTVGIQMPISLAIGSLINRFTRFKMNQLVGVAVCWISNPFTFIPMYYADLWLGTLVMGKDTSALLSLTALKVKVNSYISASAPSTWEYVKGLFLGGLGELVVPMWVGALILCVAISIPTYPMMLWIVRRSQRSNVES